ncbi:MAG: DegT/DnrJ/EryC1/StrS family aminotransferase [Vicinamibacterales bacterium]|nr:DegT/DnrJ/EryC1/StrS family aminotransferase [Vicinamibacterales bacterium]
MRQPTGMKVPLVDLGAQYDTIRDEVVAAVTRVCDSQRFILGAEVELVEKELAEYLSAKHAVGMSSGTDALLAIMMGLGVGPGDEVITTAYSFFAAAGSIARLGATPVFVDINPATFNIDPDAARAAMTSRTKAIVPVHLFGLSADMDPLLEAVSKHGVPIIEDACQAFGARYRGLPVGALGVAGGLSFFPSKSLGAYGDGGLIVTNDGVLAERLRLLRAHGAEPKYVHKIVGGNFRLDAMQAAILRAKLPHVSQWFEARREAASRYRHLFADADVEVFGVELPVEPQDRWHTYHQYVVRAPRRDELHAHLESHGIETAIYYPVPLHRQECFASLGYSEGTLPQSEAAARTALALPMYPELTEEQQAHVVKTIAEYLRMS